MEMIVCSSQQFQPLCCSVSLKASYTRSTVNTYFVVFAQNNTEVVQLDIYSGGIYLGCQYGVAAMYVWGLGVLAAGEGTTMTGCYAGQLAMEVSYFTKPEFLSSGAI